MSFWTDIAGGLVGAGEGFLVGGPVGAAVGFGVGAIGTAVVQNNTPKAPSLQSPSALSSTPTQADAANTAAATNLNTEAAAAAAGSVPSTAALLTDRENYKSTSQLLGA